MRKLDNRCPLLAPQRAPEHGHRRLNAGATRAGHHGDEEIARSEAASRGVPEVEVQQPPHRGLLLRRPEGQG
eukprot:9197845-Lingulodinium_polyedra.AAC.1